MSSSGGWSTKSPREVNCDHKDKGEEQEKERFRVVRAKENFPERFWHAKTVSVRKIAKTKNDRHGEKRPRGYGHSEKKHALKTSAAGTPRYRACSMWAQNGWLTQGGRAIDGRKKHTKGAHGAGWRRALSVAFRWENLKKR